MIILTFWLVVISGLALVGVHLWKTKNRVVAVIAPVLALALIGAVAFATFGLPNFAGMYREQVTLSMLRHRSGKMAMEAWLRSSGSDWRRGRKWEWQAENGRALYAYADETCEMACGDTIQVAFPHQIALCFISGDILTIQFTKDGRLGTWSSVPANNGC